MSRKGIVHLSADLWGKEHTTTTCVQMAMHGPCHVFSPYCSSEELWLLLLVRKYRKIEFHKKHAFPMKINGFQQIQWNPAERQACGPWRPLVSAYAHVCVCVCLCESMSNMLDATRTNVLMCAYVPSIAAGVNIRGDEDKKKLVGEKLKEHVMSLFKRFFLSSCSSPWSCKKNKEDKTLLSLSWTIDGYSSTGLSQSQYTIMGE